MGPSHLYGSVVLWEIVCLRVCSGVMHERQPSLKRSAQTLAAANLLAAACSRRLCITNFVCVSVQAIPSHCSNPAGRMQGTEQGVPRFVAA